MSVVRARDDEQAGRLTVEPVDDARPLCLVAAGDRVREQPVDERPFCVTRGGMHDDAGRLVDDEEVLVLVGDAKPDLLRGERGLPEAAEVELDLLPALQPMALRPPRSVDQDAPVGEKALGTRARADLLDAGEEPVEPLSARVGRDADSEAIRRQLRCRSPLAFFGWPAKGSRSAATRAAKRMATPVTMKTSARLNAGQ